MLTKAWIRSAPWIHGTAQIRRHLAYNIACGFFCFFVFRIVGHQLAPSDDPFNFFSDLLPETGLSIVTEVIRVNFD
jgi:hypothetical protein